MVAESRDRLASQSSRAKLSSQSFSKMMVRKLMFRSPARKDGGTFSSSKVQKDLQRPSELTRAACLWTQRGAMLTSHFWPLGSEQSTSLISPRRPATLTAIFTVWNAGVALHSTLLC